MHVPYEVWDIETSSMHVPFEVWDIETSSMHVPYEVWETEETGVVKLSINCQKRNLINIFNIQVEIE